MLSVLLDPTVVAAFLGSLLAVLLLVLWKSASPCNLARLPGEEVFVTGTTASVPVPNYLSKGDANAGEPVAGSVDISLVVPAYKETERLPTMMDETMEYLTRRQKRDTGFTFEVIVVDDGSCDGTTEVALKYVEQYSIEQVRVLTLQQNRGKGGAVKMGMLSTRGKYIWMVDADAATNINDLDACEDRLNKIEKNGMGIVCGSRAHLEDEAKASRSFLRTVLMHGFHMLVTTLCVRGVRDTQCGFKLLTRRAALATFCSLHLDRWAFDVELLYIAQQLNIPIGEVAVRWQEIDGSKLSPLEAALQMGRDLLRINALYTIGLWAISPFSLHVASEKFKFV